MAGGYVFRPVKRIKLATGTRDILIFTHNARKNGRHRASVQKGDAKSPVPLSTAEGSFSPQPIDSPYPSRSFGSSAVPTAFYILLPATHKFPTTPPTFSSSPPPLPSLPSILHHCPLHSELSRQPQSTRLPSRPSVPRASLQTGPVPGAPSSHASSQRRPGSPPPASSVRTARRRSADPRPPESGCQARTRRTPPPRTPGPLPAPPQPLLPSRSPPPPLPTQPVCKEGRPRRAGSQARLVALGAAGCVGRPAGGGGRAALHSGSPGSKAQNRPGSG